MEEVPSFEKRGNGEKENWEAHVFDGIDETTFTRLVLQTIEL